MRTESGVLVREGGSCVCRTWLWHGMEREEASFKLIQRYNMILGIRKNAMPASSVKFQERASSFINQLNKMAHGNRRGNRA